jgi:hypothetical protein
MELDEHLGHPIATGLIDLRVDARRLRFAQPSPSKNPAAQAKSWLSKGEI